MDEWKGLGVEKIFLSWEERGVLEETQRLAFAHATLNARSSSVNLNGTHLVLKRHSRIVAGVTYTLDLDPITEWSKEEVKLEEPYAFLCRGFAVPELDGNRFGYFNLVVLEGILKIFEQSETIITTVRVNNKKVKNFLGRLGFIKEAQFASYHSLDDAPVELELQKIKRTNCVIKKINEERTKAVFNLQQTI